MSLFEHFKTDVSSSSAGDQKPWFILLLLHYYVQRLFYVCYGKGYDLMCGEVTETLKDLNIAWHFGEDLIGRVYNILTRLKG